MLPHDNNDHVYMNPMESDKKLHVSHNTCPNTYTQLIQVVEDDDDDMKTTKAHNQNKLLTCRLCTLLFASQTKTT